MFRKDKGIAQEGMTTTLSPDTDLDIKNTLPNQPCMQKIVQAHEAPPSSLSRSSNE